MLPRVATWHNCCGPCTCAACISLPLSLRPVSFSRSSGRFSIFELEPRLRVSFYVFFVCESIKKKPQDADEDECIKATLYFYSYQFNCSCPSCPLYLTPPPPLSLFLCVLALWPAGWHLKRRKVSLAQRWRRRIRCNLQANKLTGRGGMARGCSGAGWQGGGRWL